MITNNTNPATTVTGITAYSNTFLWTVTSALGACTRSDQVVITSNQPINVSVQNATVSLGQTVNSNVQSGATVNPGDVLTTTIVTQPKKATANVQANGTIDFTPAAGTVGKDTVRFRLCNQCSRCVENNLIVDILNNAPVISPPPLAAEPGETLTIDLLNITSDPNNNLDPSTLKIIEQPISGARASIDNAYNLILDYSNVFFTGTDRLVIEACDLNAFCSSNTIFVQVESPADPPITVYNAVSPDGDGKHDFLEIENIVAYPENVVYIFNRWGDKVFEAPGYDNDRNRFNGSSNTAGNKDLPAGTYFYSIALTSTASRITGFLVLKR
jgi:gliding motility-associated-like protein